MTELRSKIRAGIISAKHKGKEGEDQRDGILWNHELSCGHFRCVGLETSVTQEGTRRNLCTKFRRGDKIL